MAQDDIRRRAADAGLPKLDGPHLEMFARGIEANRQLSKQLPADLHWSEEIALIFSLKPAVGTKR